MNVKAYFEQTQFLELRIKSKLAQLNSLNDLRKVVDIPLVAKKIDDLQKEVDQDIEDLINLKRDVLMLIRRVSKPEYRTVLELRYLSCWSWEKIAMNMHYCNSHVRELNAMALKECELLMEGPAESGGIPQADSDSMYPTMKKGAKTDESDAVTARQS